MTVNYLEMMIDSLKKKRDILFRIVSYNEEQDEILSKDSLDHEAFDSNMKAKGGCVDELEALDEGFQALYNRVRNELDENRQQYTKEIEELKSLISDVTALGAKIEVQERHNKIKVENMFRKERQEHREAKRSAATAKSYYQSMNKLSSEPQFMDWKQ